MSRVPRPEEEKVLLDLFLHHLSEYHADRSAAQQLVKTGDWPVPGDLDIAELAAWTSVARVLLNLHETITRN